MKNFIVNPNANVKEVSLKGYVKAPYASLLTLFGESMVGDRYKTSTEWIFESDDGDVVTLSDYKETDLYRDDLPSVSFGQGPFTNGI